MKKVLCINWQPEAFRALEKEINTAEFILDLVYGTQAAAETMAKEGPFDLLCIDITSDENNGFDFIHELRMGRSLVGVNDGIVSAQALDRFGSKTSFGMGIRYTPVIVISETVNKNTYNAAKGLALRGLYRKPFAVSVLTKKISEIFGLNNRIKVTLKR